MTPRGLFLPAVALLASATALVVGCSRSNGNYTPSPLKAEEALRAGLDAWKAELPVGIVPNTHPEVHVVDMNRKLDQRLREYKILGEKAVPSGRTFTVVLQLEEPTEEVRTYYHVVGIDPLWVFRKEDYELLAHWDHYMPEEKAKEESPTEEESPQKEPPASNVSPQEELAPETSSNEP